MLYLYGIAPLRGNFSNQYEQCRILEKFKLAVGSTGKYASDDLSAAFTDVAGQSTQSLSEISGGSRCSIFREYTVPCAGASVFLCDCGPSAHLTISGALSSCARRERFVHISKQDGVQESLAKKLLRSLSA